MVRKRDRLLFALAFIGDVLENIHDPFGLFSISFKEFYGFVPSSYRKHNFRAVLSKSFCLKDIEKKGEGDEAVYSLTDKGKAKILNQFPLVSYYKKFWDRKWRILVFDIKEANKNKRNKLRRKIYSLGFGKFQKSVYISPFSVDLKMRNYLKENELTDAVKLFIGEAGDLEEARKIADSVWNVSKLNDRYFNLWEKIKNNKGDSNVLKSARAGYMEMLMADPFLPFELLPHPFYREKINGRLQELR